MFLQTHRSAQSCNKNPKTQIGFANPNSDPLRPPILRCSFKHTDRRSKFILAQITDSSLFLQTHRSALSCNKNPKTQIIFADQNSDPLRLLILLCSFTKLLRERYIAEIQEAPRKRTIERVRFGLNCYQNYLRLVFLFAFLFSAEKFQDFL